MALHKGNGWSVDADDLDSAVFQALGAASTCWEDIAKAGVFDSDRAKTIGEGLLEWIRAHTPQVTIERAVGKVGRCTIRVGDDLYFVGEESQPKYLPSGLDEFAHTDRVDHLPIPQPDGPLLGLATTEELFREIITRFTITLRGPWATQRALILAEMLGGLDAHDREYRTAEPYEQSP